MKEDLSYIVEHAGQIGEMLVDGAFDQESSSVEPSTLEKLKYTSWELFAVEMDGEYTEEIYDPDGFLLIDEWIRLSISGGDGTAEMTVDYQYGMDPYESHIYRIIDWYDEPFRGSDVRVQYEMPNLQVHGNSLEYYDALRGTDNWPFVLPLKNEAWALFYDDESGNLRIERYRNDEDIPYYIWYLQGGPWTNNTN